jgi:hypothetical protein
VRGIVLGTIVLVGLAVIDLWFSSRLLAHVHSSADRFDTVQLASFANDDSVQLVEQALNSRYMQWGAVGVMMALFTWLITKHQPNQEKRREAERKEEREAYSVERKEEREAFLLAISGRDTLYLGTLSELRRTVEEHSDRHQQAKELLAVAMNNLASEVKATK